MVGGDILRVWIGWVGLVEGLLGWVLVWSGLKETWMEILKLNGGSEI